MAQEQVHIAQQDIPAPGYDDPTVVAFRAGDTIPPAWAEQHDKFLKELAGDGPALVKSVSPGKAGDEAQRSRQRASELPSLAAPATTTPSSNAPTNAPG
jgi:hypothetical protein